MLKEDELKQIKKEIQTFFKKASFPVEIKNLSAQNETLALELESSEPRILIGERGQTLLEIQKLLRVILVRKLNKFFYLDLDVNNYKRKKIEYLKEISRDLADEVALTKEEKILPPMPAYERRIVHLELANRSDVTSQSIDEGEKRRVVIRSYP